MKSIGYLGTIVSLLLAGCAAYQLQPLGMNHPASPEAGGISQYSVSRTLAYTTEDVPSAQPISGVAAQGGNEDRHAAKADQKTVVGEGKVVAIVPSASQVVVEHGEIKDFMEPMTMGYRVDPSSLVEGLNAGDKVRFTIDVPKKTIVKIEKLQ
jgi:Cu/Ag efflux protein CusF